MGGGGGDGGPPQAVGKASVDRRTAAARSERHSRLAICHLSFGGLLCAYGYGKPRRSAIQDRQVERQAGSKESVSSCPRFGSRGPRVIRSPGELALWSCAGLRRTEMPGGLVLFRPSEMAILWRRLVGD